MIATDPVFWTSCPTIRWQHRTVQAALVDQLEAAQEGRNNATTRLTQLLQKESDREQAFAKQVGSIAVECVGAVLPAGTARDAWLRYNELPESKQPQHQWHKDYQRSQVPQTGDIVSLLKRRVSPLFWNC